MGNINMSSRFMRACFRIVICVNEVVVMHVLDVRQRNSFVLEETQRRVV